MRLFWDIESNGLLDTISKVHCICAIDLDTGQEYAFGPDQIEEALRLLHGATLHVGHNLVRYDLPALKKVRGWEVSGTVRDTLILARLKHPDTRKKDDLTKVLPPKNRGSDSLESWGLRLGIHKASYDGGWEQWSQEMQDYCLQDCRTGVALWKHLNVEEMDPFSVELEHRVAEICFRMEEAGWHINVPAAGDLYTKLVQRRHELETALVEKFGSWDEVDKILIPKRDNKTRGYKAGVPVTKMKTVVFNPNSRRHIEKKLRELGWKPTEFTDSGQAKLDEEVLENVDLPQAQQIIEYLLVQKRIGQLADGSNGILKLVKDGRIHGSYKTLGTSTGRASHLKPNVAQTPTVKAPYGKEFRSLYTVPKGWKLVGADFEGLELRCLAHMLSFFDDGKYAEIVTDGDVHSYHAEMLEASRDVAKRWIYAWLYGAGLVLLAAILGQPQAKAKVIIQQFIKRIPGLERLKRAVLAAAERGFIKGLDKRVIPVASPHVAVNYLLQNAGAVLCKVWLMDTYDKLISSGLRWGYDGDFVIAGFIHDELQIACREGIEDTVGAIVTDAARNAGHRFNFRCRLDSKYVVGTNWAETH